MPFSNPPLDWTCSISADAGPPTPAPRQQLLQVAGISPESGRAQCTKPFLPSTGSTAVPPRPPHSAASPSMNAQGPQALSPGSPCCIGPLPMPVGTPPAPRCRSNWLCARVGFPARVPPARDVAHTGGGVSWKQPRPRWGRVRTPNGRGSIASEAPGAAGAGLPQSTGWNVCRLVSGGWSRRIGDARQGKPPGAGACHEVDPAHAPGQPAPLPPWG